MIGTLRKYRGRIEFDYLFSSAPDVWLRNSSSGTEYNLSSYPSGNGIQYYDPYGAKSLEVISVDEYGFAFEIKYWEIAFYKNGSQYIGTIQLPNMNNIHTDYTAVGNETSIPNNGPLSVSISGPNSVEIPGTYSYSAIGSGGTQPYQTYYWYKRPAGGS